MFRDVHRDIKINGLTRRVSKAVPDHIQAFSCARNIEIAPPLEFDRHFAVFFSVDMFFGNIHIPLMIARFEIPSEFNTQARCS